MVAKRILVIDAGEKRESNDTDNLLNLIGALNSVTDGTNTANNPTVLNFKGTKFSVSSHSTSNTAVVKVLSGGRQPYNHVNPDMKSHETNLTSQIVINPFRVMLPDRAIVTQSSQITLDKSSDLQSGYTPSANEWGYIYATDESGYTKKAFMSNTKPLPRGFHPTLNAKFIGSFRLDGSTNILPFGKFGFWNMYKDLITVQSFSSSSTSVSTISVANFLPPITDLFLGFSYMSISNDTQVSRILGSKLDDTYRNIYEESGNARRLCKAVVKTTSDRKVFHLSNVTVGNTNILYSNGYIEDTDNPLQYIT